MAIGYQALGVPFRLSAESLGQPSYADAIAKGLRNAGLGMEISARPSQLAEQLLAAKLANQINTTRAKYEEPRQLAGLRGMDLANQINAIRAKYAEPKELAGLQGSNLANQLSAIRAKYAEPEALAELQQRQNALDLNPLQKKLIQSRLDTQEYNRALLSQKMGQNGVPLTTAVKTLNQNIINGIPKVQNQIENIISSPSPFNLTGWYPGEQAAHDAMVNDAADTLVKAKGWANTNESLHRALKILDRGTLESDAAYHKRLRKYSEELGNDFTSAQETLNKGINTKSNGGKKNIQNKRLKYNLTTGRLE